MLPDQSPCHQLALYTAEWFPWKHFSGYHYSPPPHFKIFKWLFKNIQQGIVNIGLSLYLWLHFFLFIHLTFSLPATWVHRICSLLPASLLLKLSSSRRLHGCLSQLKPKFRILSSEGPSPDHTICSKFSSQPNNTAMCGPIITWITLLMFFFSVPVDTTTRV